MRPQLIAADNQVAGITERSGGVLASMRPQLIAADNPNATLTITYDQDGLQ